LSLPNNLSPLANITKIVLPVVQSIAHVAKACHQPLEASKVFAEVLSKSPVTATPMTPAIKH